MRICAAVLGQFPPRLAHNLDEVEDFGGLPRWIGGATGVEDGGLTVLPSCACAEKCRLEGRGIADMRPVTWRILCEVS